MSRVAFALSRLSATWFRVWRISGSDKRRKTPDAKSIVTHVSSWQFETEGALTVILRLVFCLGLMACASSTTKTIPDTSSLKAWVESHSNREIFALRLAIEPFFADPFLRLTSVDAELPLHIAPAQLNAVGVEQVLICVGGPVANDLSSASDDNGGLSWAAVATLREPLGIGDLLQRWTEARIVRRQQIVPEQFTSANGREYFRVPAGTFLTRPVRSGVLLFEDESGIPQPHGINVGDIDPYYEYFGSDEQNRAIINFYEVSDQDYSSAGLELILTCAVLQTQFRNFEPVILNVCVRNPATGVESEHFEVAVTPDREVRFTIPETLKSADKSSPRNLDLREDFTSDGQVQLCFDLQEPFVYCGFGNQSVQLVREESEYIQIRDKVVFVAESEDRLNVLLDDHVSIQSLLSTPASTVNFFGQFGIPRVRTAVLEFAVFECGFISVVDFMETLTEIDGSLNLTKGVSFEMTSRFSDASSAESQSKLLIDGIAGWWTDFRENAKISIRRSAQIGGFVQLAFDGVSTAFPVQPMSIEKRVTLMDAFVGQPEDVPRITLKDGSIDVSFSRPEFQFSGPAQKSDFLSNLYFAVGSELSRDQRIEHAENPLRLASQVCPSDLGLALTTAHLYCFNAPRQHFDATMRYAFVRQGLMLILDSLEQSENHADHMWLLARILSRKVADPLYEADRLCPLFSSDRELQERIRMIIGFPETKETWNPEASSVAEQLLSTAIRLRESSPKSGVIPSILLYSDRAFAAARVAEALMRRGSSDEAATAWTHAFGFYDEVARKPLISLNTEMYSLFDLPQVRKEQPANSPVIERIELEYDRTDCFHGFDMCDVARTVAMNEAMSLIRDARVAGKSSTEVVDLYEKAFLTLDAAFTKENERIAVAHLLAPEWQYYEFIKLRNKRQTNDALDKFAQSQALFRKHSEYRFSRLQMLIQNEAEPQP